MTQAIKLLVLYNSTFFHCKCILTGPQNDLLEAILVNEHKNEFYYIKLTATVINYYYSNNCEDACIQTCPQSYDC